MYVLQLRVIGLCILSLPPTSHSPRVEHPTRVCAREKLQQVSLWPSTSAPQLCAPAIHTKNVQHEAILTVLQRKANELDRSQSSDEQLTQWLMPTVNFLNTLSATLGEGVGT